MNWLNKIHVGDAVPLLQRMAADGVRAQVCVTSPPFYGLRSYLPDNHPDKAKEIGLEESLPAFIERVATVFDAVWDVLEKDGTLWIEMGDAYYSSGGTGNQGKHGARNNRRHTQRNLIGNSARRAGRHFKDMMGQPWRLAFALQDRGWILRQEIIWHKPDCLPESTRDRPTTSHSHIFLFAKTRYYRYYRDAIAEPCSPNTHLRISQALAEQRGSLRANGGTRADRPMKALLPAVREAPGQPRTRPKGVNPKAVAGWQSGPGSHKAIDHAKGEGGVRKFKARPRANADMSEAISGPLLVMRNARTVWRIPTEKFSGPHFATFPVEIPRRAILAGSLPGQVILDPFMGSGATAQAACELGRQFVGCELNPESVRTAYNYRSFQTALPPVLQRRA